MATYTGTLGAAPALAGASVYSGRIGAAPALNGAQTYRGRLGSAPVLNGAALYAGLVGAAPALWATVETGTLGAAPYQDGQAIEPPATVNRVRYYVRLVADGFEDLYLPAENFNIQRSFERTSYASITVPGVDQAAAVRDRQDGEIVVERERELTDGTLQVAELYRGPVDSIQPQEGARRSTLQIRGAILPSDQTAGTIQRVAIRDLYLQSEDEDGNLTVRAAPINELRPGDQIEIDGETREARVVQHRVNQVNFVMEIHAGPVL